MTKKNKPTYLLERRDAFEGLKRIKTGSVDTVITDPPYLVGFQSQRKKDGSDWASYSMLNPFYEKLFGEFKRILKPTGKVFMFTDWRTYPAIYFSSLQHMAMKNMIVWDFGWIKNGNHFRYTHELIAYFAMPKAKPPKNRGLSDVWRVKPVNFSVERNHPAEKPVDLIEKMLLECTEKGDKVLDCFMGSGTTAVACKRLGRSFIGFELNKNYFEMSKIRLDQAIEEK